MTYMLKDILQDRIGMEEIRVICSECIGRPNDSAKEELFGLIYDSDDRIAYNALWIFTHFPAAEIQWLSTKRDEFIDLLMSATHVGKRRLLLTLLDRLPVEKDQVRQDYLDFCLSAINSTEPYGIRALCMKQAFAQSRFYPELLHELELELEMTQYGELSPGIMSARKNIMKRIAALRPDIP